MVYTDRQRELIRAKVKEYYDLHHFGARTISWAGLCDAILNDTRKHVRYEPLRQWVTGFVAKDRNQPLRPRPEEMEAIVEFLMLPDIDMLSPEELEDLEIPHRLLRSLLQYLRIDPNTPLPPPPPDLQGLYEAWHRVENPDEAEEQWIKISLRLEIDHPSRVVCARETWEIHFRGDDEVLMPSGERPSEGWGIVTPEGNLCLFMKTKPWKRSYYYLPVGVNSRYLALLRHQPPEDRGLPETFEQLTEQMKKRTLLLNFNKVGKKGKTETGA